MTAAFSDACPIFVQGNLRVGKGFIFFFQTSNFFTLGRFSLPGRADHSLVCLLTFQSETRDSTGVV